MCRKNQLLGWIIISFFLGLLIGAQLDWGFWLCLIWIGGIVLGCSMLRKK